MSPHLTPHKSSHGPSPTPINLDRDNRDNRDNSPNGTMAHSSVQSQPTVPNESPRKNSISGSGPEWTQDYEDALPVKGLLSISGISLFIYLCSYFVIYNF
jgi:hypothetical protein